MLKSYQNDDEKLGKILEETEEYTGMNAAQACCRNGHLAVLKMIVDMDPKMCQVKDLDGNVALHHLCYNTTTKMAELKVMFEIVNHAFPGGKMERNGGTGPHGPITPMDILSQR